jgi:hypothetical protein
MSDGEIIKTMANFIVNHAFWLFGAAAIIAALNCAFHSEHK